jgi:hypothetical protein
MPTARSCGAFQPWRHLWRAHQAAVGWHDHEDRVGQFCGQDDCSEQPTPPEGAEKGNDPEEPSDDRKARLIMKPRR